MGGINFPESLYEQYKDAHVARPPDHIYTRETVSGASAGLGSAEYSVPPDMDGTFGILSIALDPGAAQWGEKIYIQVKPPNYPSDPIFFFYFGSNQVLTPAQRYSANLPFPLTLEAGSKWQVTGTFNAGVALNTLRINAMMCCFPRMLL